MVEWKKLGEVCTFNRGRTITAKDAVDGGIPVIAGGQAPSYYHNEANRDGESITVAGSGAYAGFVSYWNQPIFVSDAFTVDPTNLVKHKYLYHWLKLNQSNVFATQKGAGVPHVHGKDIANFLIPIPSLSEQARIVGILDTFTSAIDNLKEQIAQRRKQYEYYRDKLLDLEGKPGVEMKTLGEVCEVYTGGEVPNNTIKGQLSATEEYPYAVYANGKDTYGYSNTYQIAEDAVCISSIGANTGAVFYKKGKFTPAIRLKVLIPKDGVITKYLFYASSKIDFRGKNTGSVPNINANYVKNKHIPLPPLQEQQRIVSILDTFEDSIQNLEAQLDQRQKQYEYYRNKLLTFE